MNRTRKCFLLSILLLGVLAILLLGNQKVSALERTNDHEVIDTYQYTTNSETREWKSRTIQQNREALRIPDDVLSRLSNKALYEAFITYPFLGDVYAYAQTPEHPDKALARMESYFSAYQEVLRRDLTLTELAVEYALAQLKDDNQKMDSLKGLSFYTVQTFVESSCRAELFDREGGLIAAKWIMTDLVMKEIEQDADLINKVKADLSPDTAMVTSSAVRRTLRGSAIKGLFHSEPRSFKQKTHLLL